jgi:hypothetical protein
MSRLSDIAAVCSLSARSGLDYIISANGAVGIHNDLSRFHQNTEIIDERDRHTGGQD